MELTIEKITPEKAQEFLNQNTRNRKISERQVNILVDQLQKGLWKNTHQGIGIAADGTLLDGQHRLTAIVRSGISIDMLVVRGLDKNCLNVVDTGRKRSAGDSFAIEGIPDPNLTASGTRVYELYGRCKDKTWSGHLTTTSITELHEHYALNIGEDRGQFARSVARKVYSNLNSLKPSVLFAAVLILQDYGHDDASISEFFKKLGEGHELKEDSPILIYRRHVIRIIKKLRCTKEQQDQLNEIIKVFNQSYTNASIKRQFVAPETTPMQTPKIGTLGMQIAP